MIYSSHRFTLDIQKLHSQISVPVSLGDTAKTFYITLKDGGEPYFINTGCLAMLSIKRPHGTFLQAFCAIEDNTRIKYDFSENPATAIEEGIHDCELTLTSPDGLQLSSSWFNMVVYERVVNFDDIDITEAQQTQIDAMLKAEAQRQVSETERASAESTRTKNEAERQAAEKKRSENETARVYAETARANAEVERENSSLNMKVELLGLKDDVERALAGGGSSAKTVWTCTGKIRSGAPVISSEYLKPIAGETLDIGDYIIDSGGSLCKITSISPGGDYVYIDMIYYFDETKGSTIWRATVDLTGAGAETTPMRYDNILERIEGRTPRADDYVLDVVGNILRIDGVFEGGFYVHDTAPLNRRLKSMETRLETLEEALANLAKFTDVSEVAL